MCHARAAAISKYDEKTDVFSFGFLFRRVTYAGCSTTASLIKLYLRFCRFTPDQPDTRAVDRNPIAIGDLDFEKLRSFVSERCVVE